MTTNNAATISSITPSSVSETSTSTQPSVTVEGKDLVAALKYIKGAVATKATLPVLNNVLLVMRGDILQVAATNLETGIETGVPVQTSAGILAITLPLRLLLDSVSAKGQITLTLDERTRTATISQGRMDTEIKGISAEEFPIVPDISTQAPIAYVDGPWLRQSITRTVFAASSDDARPVLAGLYIKLTDSCATFAAVDGFRMGRVQGCDIVADGDHELIVPARAMVELAKLGMTGEVAVYLTPNRNQVLFVGNNGRLTCRIVPGKYVDINRVIPTDYATRTVLDRKALIEAVKACVPFAKDSQNISRYTIENNVLSVSSHAEAGGRRVAVDCTVEGEQISTVALNVRFVLDALATIETDLVALETKTPGSPAVIKPVSANGCVDSEQLHVIMPQMPHGLRG